MADSPTSVVIVGGGFAGLACAQELSGHDIEVTLVDRHNYHQFQPLLYQVATAQSAPSDVASPLREILRKKEDVTVKEATVTSVDPDGRVIDTAEGATFSGDYLVLAAGSAPNFFSTPGADEHAFPLYSLRDAEDLRSRIFELFEEVDTRPELVDRGALNFVIIGGGPTGVEMAGALADLVEEVMAARFGDLDVGVARIILVDHGDSLLKPFSDSAHEYAARVLTERGVELRMGTGAAAVHDDRVELSDGTDIPTRCVVWAGGVEPASLGVPGAVERGPRDRLATEPDLSLVGRPQVYAVGDVAEIHDADGTPLPQLGSVAAQAGAWAASNIRRHAAGRPTRPFAYRDKGIMAMIGRNAAVAELGKKRHELHGHLAFTAWLGTHATLMSGVRPKVDLFMAWAWDHFSANREPSLIDDEDAELTWPAES